MEGSEQDDSSHVSCPVRRGELPKSSCGHCGNRHGKGRECLTSSHALGDTFSFAIFIIRREIWPKSDFFLPFSYGVWFLLLVSLFCLDLFCCVFWFCFGFFPWCFCFFFLILLLDLRSARAPEGAADRSVALGATGPQRHSAEQPSGVSFPICSGGGQ